MEVRFGSRVRYFAEDGAERAAIVVKAARESDAVNLHVFGRDADDAVAGIVEGVRPRRAGREIGYDAIPEEY